MFNKSDLKRDNLMLNGSFKRRGYDWWWHSFTAISPDNEEVPFFIEFFLVNIKNKDKVVHGENCKNKPAYLMIKAGCWKDNKCQLHRFIPIKDIEIGKNPYYIKGEDFLCSETRLQGKVKVDKETALNHPEYLSDSGEIEFDLKIDKKITFNVGYGASSLFRFLKAFEMYWHAEGMKSLFEGTITLNGIEYKVEPDTCYGYADKNWGKDFTSPWLWLASSNLYSKKYKKQLTNSCFDIGGGKPKAFGIRFKDKLLGALYLEGEEYEYNFSKFWMGVKISFDFKVEDDLALWDVRLENKKSVMKTHVEAKLKDLLFINYENPLGLKKFSHLYNGGNGIGTIKLYKKKRKELTLIDELIIKNVGCEYGEFDK